AAAIFLDHGAGDEAQAEAPPRIEPQRFLRLVEMRAGVLLDAMLDVADDRLGLAVEAVRHEPARAFRNEAAQQEDAEAECCTNAETEAPAEVDRQQFRVEENDRRGGAEGRADPVAAIDDEVDTAAQPR